jgi:hypothetical protein
MMAILVAWPGFIIWFGWISIAQGKERFDKAWFWLLCALWNAAFLGWAFQALNYGEVYAEAGAFGIAISWYSRLHILTATVSALIFLYLMPRKGDSVKRVSSGKFEGAW